MNQAEVVAAHENADKWHFQEGRGCFGPSDRWRAEFAKRELVLGAALPGVGRRNRLWQVLSIERYPGYQQAMATVQQVFLPPKTSPTNMVAIQ